MSRNGVFLFNKFLHLSVTIVSPSFTIKFERFPLCVKFVPAVVLLCLCAIEVYSQDHNLHFRHLTLADGLLDMQVSDGMQDSRGFVWFATRQGVQRYDGKQFLTFTDLDLSLIHI